MSVQRTPPGGWKTMNIQQMDKEHPVDTDADTDLEELFVEDDSKSNKGTKRIMDDESGGEELKTTKHPQKKTKAGMKSRMETRTDETQRETTQTPENTTPLQATLDLVRNLNKVCNEHINTKLEIKRIANALNKSVAAAQKTYENREQEQQDKIAGHQDEIQELKNKIDTISEENISYRKREQDFRKQITEIQGKINKLEVENSTLQKQITDNTPNKNEHNILCRRCNATIENKRLEEVRKAELLTELEQALSGCTTDGELVEIINKEWPVEAFKRSKQIHESITDTRRSRALILTDKENSDAILIKKNDGRI